MRKKDFKPFGFSRHFLTLVRPFVGEDEREGILTFETNSLR